MAKERKSAVSLFADMGKNRDITTEGVNNEPEALDDQKAGQYKENAENTGKNENNDVYSKEEQDEVLTEQDNKDDDTVETYDKITSDINENASFDTDFANSAEDIPDEIYDETPKRRGRKPGKANQEIQHIHIALPIDVYEKLEIGKKAYYNNKTIYIRNLIINDYEKNKEVYENLPTIR